MDMRRHRTSTEAGKIRSSKFRYRVGFGEAVRTSARKIKPDFLSHVRSSTGYRERFGQALS